MNQIRSKTEGERPRDTCYVGKEIFVVDVHSVKETFKADVLSTCDYFLKDSLFSNMMPILN